MGPRLYVGGHGLRQDGEAFALTEGASRHVQVLRLQPGDALRLFDGHGREWHAQVAEMGRKWVHVRLGGPVANQSELPLRVTLAVGMPANDRMDAVVEKATELGVHAIQPLVCARSVLRLDGERAVKKVAHWQAVAVSASEQCGRAVVPQIHAVQSLETWLKHDAGSPVASHRGVLSLREAVGLMPWLTSGALSGGAQGKSPSAAEAASAAGAAMAADAAEDTAALAARGLAETASAADTVSWCFLNGPEGGLAPEEEALALRQGWTAVSLGKRVLRADTAPLAVLSVMAALLAA